MILVTSMFCCTCLSGMDIFKKKSGRKGDSSQTSHEEASGETSGQNSPKASSSNYHATKKPIAMTSSAGAPKKTVSNMQELKDHHAALKQSGGLTQSGDTSSNRK